MVQPTVSPESAAASCSAVLESTHVVNAADVLAEYDDDVTGTFTIPRLVATPGVGWRFSHWLVNAHFYWKEINPRFPPPTTREGECDDAFRMSENPSLDEPAYGEWDYTITLNDIPGHYYTSRYTFTAIEAVFVTALPSGPILCNHSGVLVCNHSGELLWH